MAKTLFVLASKSPRRKELLKNIEIQAEIIPANVDESALSSLPPEKMVTQLALLKATDVARSFGGNTYVIAADTVVVMDGKIFGKPHDIADAKRMLTFLSGATHSVYTGYCVIRCSDGTAVARFEKTDVTFRTLTDSEIDAYIKTREPMDKAGAYGIQGKGSIFIEKINGDYFNVVGLPVCALSKLLREEFDINILKD
ncbi:MAG: septum formation inhibitor Maf [Clostridia bacterium]|nr:septum formation inhibitor Maf [Clostridia bacterium]